MKSLAAFILTLLSLALAGQMRAQTPSEAEAYRKAGAAYFKAGQFRESVTAYQQVLRLNPDDTDAYMQLGDAFLRLGMNKEAAAAFEKGAGLLEKQAELLSAKGASAPAVVSPPAATQAMPLEEIARRLIRKQSQIICSLALDKTYTACDSRSVPTRVTFASVQVNSQGTDNYPVKASITVRHYYRDSTYTYDQENLYILRKGAFGWEIQTDEGRSSGNRYDPVSALPPPGETEVPPPVAVRAQPDRGKQAAANGAGAAIPVGKYDCVMYAGGQLIHVGGFTLQAGGVHSDEDKGRGTFAYDSSQHQITFQGAAMSGQVGRYDSGGKFTLKSARDSVDCDRGN